MSQSEQVTSPVPSSNTSLGPLASCGMMLVTQVGIAHFSFVLCVFFCLQSVAQPEIAHLSKAAPYPVQRHLDQRVCLMAIVLMVARRGCSVLIIIGSNLKLIFESIFLVVFFYIGEVTLGQAQSPSKSIISSLRRAGSQYAGKGHNTGANTECLVLVHLLILLKLTH